VKTTGNYGRPGYAGALFAAALATAISFGQFAMFATANADGNRPMAPQKIMPPARDPEIAVEEEYQIARQRGAVEALQLFIARHPEGPFADRARADLRRISR
jgi:hypothetical protein